MRNLINDQLKLAESEGNILRLRMLRLIKTAIADQDNALRAAGQAEWVPDDNIRDIIKTMIRQREKSARGYEEHGRLDLFDGEKQEIAILTELLPPQLSDDEVTAAVKAAMKSTGATEIRHKGRVMRELRQLYPGQMDFQQVGKYIEARFRSA